MKLITVILILLITNIITFIITLVNSKKIMYKIEKYIAKIMFNKIINNSKKKIDNVDELSFKDIFGE